jgi:ribosomal protein L32E
MKTRFVRPDTHLFVRIGKGRKKMQKWRRPRGKQNKTRLNRFGYLIQPGIGFGSPKADSGKVKAYCLLTSMKRKTSLK